MSDWQEKTIGELVTFQRGYDLAQTEFKGGSYPIVGSNGIIGYHDKFTSLENGITIGRSGNIGNPFFIESKFWAHNTCLFVKDFHDSEPKFIYYLLKTLNLKNLNSGSAVPSLNRNSIHPILVVVPERDEQIRIAKTLSILDRKIDNLRKQNQALETLAQTLFTHWFIDFEFPDINGNPYKSSGGKMIDSEMGSIPSGWGVGSFLSKFKLLSGGTPDTTNSDYWNGKIKWISAKDITPNHQQYLLETDKCISQTGIDNSATKLLPSLTTIISARGTVGKFCIIPEKMCISQSNYGIRALDEGIEFYTYLVVANSVNQLKSYAYGSVFDTITTKTFKDLEIIIPPINIIKSFEQLVKSIFLKKLNNSIQIKKLTEISESLLPKLMSGQLRIK